MTYEYAYILCEKIKLLQIHALCITTLVLKHTVIVQKKSEIVGENKANDRDWSTKWKNNKSVDNKNNRQLPPQL